MNKAIVNIISSLLILLFAYTAFSKLTSLGAFERTLEAAPLLKWGAHVVAIVMPLLEAAIVGLLLFPATKKWGLYASAILLSLFTLYLLYMILFVPHLPCSCGGVLSSLSWREHVWFNIFFIVLSCIGIISLRREKKAEVITSN